jgi:iron complex transport system ATP-binding protein
MTSHDLRAENLTLGYSSARTARGETPASTDVVRDLDVQIPDGRITVIVGANACGKSTLLRGLARLLAPRGGQVTLDGTPVQEMRSIDVAKVLGLLPQTPVAPDGISVGDLVGRGRYPHQGWFRRWSAEDDAAVAAALEATGTTELEHRSIAELSGGQRQRVWIAMALAQDTDLLLLDEPTTYLDISHQVELLDLLTDLNRESGKTVVLVLHDLNLACRYADHLIAMKDGAILAEGAPRDVIDAAVVTEVFGLDCEVVPDPVSGTPMIVPRGRHHARAEVVRTLA